MVKNTETTVALTEELVAEVDRISKTEGDLSLEDERRLIEIYKLTGDVRLGADVMYVKQYDSIAKICKQFAFRHHRKQSVMDYIQSSYEYMIEALDTYKFSAGARFNTHLTITLTKCLNDSWYKENNTSKYYQQEYFKIGRYISNFEKCNGRTPTDIEIMKAFGYTESRYTTILMEAQAFIPLCIEEIRDEVKSDVFDKNNHMTEDVLFLDRNLCIASPDDILMDQELSEAIAALLDDLGPERSELLMKYAGIGYDKPQSVSRICSETGLTRSYVNKNLSLILAYAREKLAPFYM